MPKASSKKASLATVPHPAVVVEVATDAAANPPAAEMATATAEAAAPEVNAAPVEAESVAVHEGGAVEAAEVAAAAPAVAVPAAVAVTVPADLPQQVEALLLTSGRAVPALRLAVALGLAPNEEAAEAMGGQAGKGASKQTGSGKQAEGDADGAAAATPPPPKRRRKGKAGAEHDPAAIIAAAVEELNGVYAKSGRSFRVEAVAGGYRLMTLPSYGGVVARFQNAQSSAKLSRAAVETLAIIAYRQPVTRATLEAIRGVACGEILKTLMERRLITIAGRAEELGRPILYATSKGFLEAFGLSSLKDLPTVAEAGLKP